jgi:hypothetical protein
MSHIQRTFQLVAEQLWGAAEQQSDQVRLAASTGLGKYPVQAVSYGMKRNVLRLGYFLQRFTFS